MRNQADWTSTPIQPETFARLVTVLETSYPGKVRRVVEVCPVAIVKTIDNERDALTTIRNVGELYTGLLEALKDTDGLLANFLTYDDPRWVRVREAIAKAEAP